MMTERVQKFLNFHLDRGYRINRKDISASPIQKEVEDDLKVILDNSEPLLYENDLFGFNRSVGNLADQKPNLTNYTPDYKWALDNGFDAMKTELALHMERANGKEKKDFYARAIRVIDMTIAFAKRYKNEAKKQGNIPLFQALCVVPEQGAKDYYQALVFMKILIFILRSMNVCHLTLGRFDQYLYPFYAVSKANGATENELLELTELFFISINMDTDLYAGIQQGDNGQSLLVGGRTLTGEDGYNELSEAVMTAAEDLCLIDPKINLRVDKNTPIERYIRATFLTKKGLGFPQYCNDDIVIEGLQKLGYDYEDAVDYTVAACWEFITPTGFDVPNVAWMNFPFAVRNATIKALEQSVDFEDFMQAVEKEIDNEIEQIKIDGKNEFYRLLEYDNPFAAIFVKNCRETGISAKQGGGKYKNLGVHGLGIAPATDALAAIKKLVFEEKSITAKRLIQALENNFNGEEELRNQLLACPKMGNNDEYVDELSTRLLGYFSKRLNGMPNFLGGIYRAGTGAPHFYVYAAETVGATADGRLANQPYPSSFSPSLHIKTEGPLSVIQSFTKFDMTNAINGGPLTLEIHDNVFRNDDGIKKVALLVKAFIDRGGHQLQLNAINRDRLLDAQKHPEQYPNLIVRVWGWSGYFTELDLCFQNQIISRTEYSF